MKTLSAQMTNNNEQIKTQIKKMTVAIILVSGIILFALAMVVINLF